MGAGAKGKTTKAAVPRKKPATRARPAKGKATAADDTAAAEERSARARRAAATRKKNREAAKLAEAEATAKKAASDRKKGDRLPAAQQAARDSLMIQRLAQDWTWPAIAAEAGITEHRARMAVKARQQSAPLALNMDPVHVIEKIAEGLQLSIGDLEAMSSFAIQDENVHAAVAAKKAANDARQKLMVLIQATGRLPQQLEQLRHLIDLRMIATRMLDAVDQLETDSAQAIDAIGDEQVRAQLEDAIGGLRDTFQELIGMGAPPASLDGTADEVADAEVA